MILVLMYSVIYLSRLDARYQTVESLPELPVLTHTHTNTHAHTHARTRARTHTPQAAAIYLGHEDESQQNILMAMRNIQLFSSLPLTCSAQLVN